MPDLAARDLESTALEELAKANMNDDSEEACR
jgi:hypothetical protein